MTTIFSDGFESGSFSFWTETTYKTAHLKCKIQLLNLARTLESLLLPQVAAMQTPTEPWLTYTTVYHRFYVRFDTLPTSGQGVLLGFLCNGSSNNTVLGIGLRYNNGPKWFVGYLKGGTYTLLYSSVNTPQTNTWYCLELKALVNASSGTVEAWIDGIKDNGLSDTTGFDNDDWGSMTGFCLPRQSDRINLSFVGIR